MIHCSWARLASRSSPIVRSATLTTVPSSSVIPGAEGRGRDRPPARSAYPSGSGCGLRTCARAPTVFFRRGDAAPGTTEHRLVEHVDRLGDEHPPIDLGDRRLHGPRPATCSTQRFGHVLDYMARVELEVDRNVLELTTMLPDPPRSTGLLRRRVAAAGDPARPDPRRAPGAARPRRRPTPDLDNVSAKIRVLGALAHLDAVQDVVPDALLPDRHGHRALRGARLQPAPRRASPSSARPRSPRRSSAQIRRQEPGHYAFYKMSARGLWPRSSRPGSSGWSGACARISFAPGRRQQRRAEGRLRRPDGAPSASTDDLDDFAEQISRVERELLWARDRGLRVPDYVARGVPRGRRAGPGRAAALTAWSAP